MSDEARRALLPLTTFAVFLGASLLFAVQPMVAKMLLPSFGGAPAVWNTCLVFYQAVLLLGYFYAHALASRATLKTQLAVHSILLLVALVTGPISLKTVAASSERPVLELLGRLLAGVGLPFFALSGGGPLLQSWFAASRERGAKDPYFLYAASNAGSLLSLLAYPVLIEPRFRLADQSRLFTAGLFLLLVLTLGCGLLVLRTSAPPDAVRVRSALRFRRDEQPAWLVLAFLPCSLMMAVTLHVTTEIAPVPFLWLAPLGLYLLAFSLAFTRVAKTLVLGAAWLALLFGAIVLYFRYSGIARPVWLALALPMATLFAAALACLGRLSAARPDPARLTEYYAWIGAGGVLAGVFNALLAPLLFSRVLEYPIVLIVTLSAIAGFSIAPRTTRRALVLELLLSAALTVFSAWFLANAPFSSVDWTGLAELLHYPRWSLERGFHYALPILAVLSFALFRLPRAFVLGLVAFAIVADRLDEAVPLAHRSRDFFGVLTVRDRGNCRNLVHGSTLHGQQLLDPRARRVPLTFYSAEGPAGDVFAEFGPRRRSSEIAVVGLGAGTLAAYGERDQHITFYEIDPGVVAVAQDPRLFTFLSDSAAKVRVVLGDARLRLAEESRARFDLLVLDAFSSDAIPMHLLTREALALYLEKLRPGGVIALHVTNRYLDLERFVGRVADDLGLAARIRAWNGTTACGPIRATWIVLARSAEDLGSLARNPSWRALARSATTPLWTDDFSNLLLAVDWRGSTR